MRKKKIITGILSVTMLTMPLASALGADLNSTPEIVPIKAPIEDTLKIKYQAKTGTVINVADHGKDGAKRIAIGDGEEITANVIITEDTYIVGDGEIMTGSEITWFVDVNKPMILIYPPLYYPEVLVLEEESVNSKFDIFDENLVSSDNMLKIKGLKNTSIVLKDDTPYEGELDNKKLLVLYGPSTRSIPAQTNPDKIVVFPEEDDPKILESEDIVIPPEVQEETLEEDGTEDIKLQDIFTKDISEMDIVVNDKKIHAPGAYLDDEDNVMVPLRSISEALGFDVTWDDKERAVYLGNLISLRIGKDYYTYAKMAPIHLGLAPELVDGTTYVPLSFFKKVVGLNNAYVFEGQIDINDGELMH